MRKYSIATFGLAIAVLAIPSFALAVPITASGSFHFRDIRSPNSVGFFIGDRLTFGATVSPNGDDDGDGFADNAGPPTLPTTGIGTQGGASRALSFVPSQVNPNQFVTSVAFDSALTNSWQLDFTNDTDTTTIFTPSPGNVSNTPFVGNMSLTGSGVTPTFNWTVPTGSTADRVTIRIFDLEDFTAAGPARQLLAESLNLATTSFEVPVGELEADHLYSVAIQLDDRANSRLVSRSRSFFDFSTETLNVPGDAPVFLPSVNPTGNPTGGPVYEFDISVVGGSTVFIDPLVAIGYDYAIGDGDPRFASVILPDAGDGFYELFLFDGTEFVFDTSLTAGVEHFFQAEGVELFRILGIETSAGLDPLDATAFVTGLSFVGDGQFTGTMTPITENVPEPSTIAAFGIGLIGLAFAKRRRKPT